MSKYLSNRQKKLKIGITSYTENETVLEVTGKVGIGTTNSESKSLFVVGDTKIVGIVTASEYYGNLRIGTPTGGFQIGAVAITTSFFTKDAIDDINYIRHLSGYSPSYPRPEYHPVEVRNQD